MTDNIWRLLLFKFTEIIETLFIYDILKKIVELVRNCLMAKNDELIKRNGKVNRLVK